MTLFATLLDGVLGVDPSAPALVFEGRWSAWESLGRAHDQIQANLVTLEMGPDMRVGVMLRNRPASLAALVSVVCSGRCLVAINPLLTDEKLVSDLEALQLPVVLAEALDLERPAVASAIARLGVRVIELEPALEGARLVPPGPATPGDVRRHAPGVAIEMLTSGTTGEPKRVALKRASLESSFSDAMAYEGDRRSDAAPRLRRATQILSNPLAHIGGMWGALSAVLAGRKLCLLERFSVEAWRRAIVEHRPKVSAVVPAGLRMVLDADIPAEDLSSLVALRTGTAPLDAAIVDEFLRRYGIAVLQSYGATEFAGAVAGWTLRDFQALYRAKVGSVGRLHKGVKARVLDAATLDVLAPGEEGLLELSAPQLGLDGGWTRTTDLAVVDVDGFLWIKGRVDNAIIRGGFKIHPADVIAALEQHPGVREAVVVGIADRRLGEAPVAAIVAAAGYDPDPAELTAFLRERLMPYQIPVSIRVVDDLPRTSSMKPSLPSVRALFAG